MPRARRSHFAPNVRLLQPPQPNLCRFPKVVLHHHVWILARVADLKRKVGRKGLHLVVVRKVKVAAGPWGEGEGWGGPAAQTRGRGGEGRERARTHRAVAEDSETGHAKKRTLWHDLLMCVIHMVLEIVFAAAMAGETCP